MTDKNDVMLYLQRTGGTGSQISNKDYKIVKFYIDKFEICVKLTLDDKFIGVVSIKTKKDFIPLEDKVTNEKYVSIDEIFPFEGD